MGKKVMVDFGPNGEIRVEAEGFQGTQCKEATEFLENALGTPQEESQKLEWFVQNGSRARQDRERYGYEPLDICG